MNVSVDAVSHGKNLIGLFGILSKNLESLATTQSGVPYLLNYFTKVTQEFSDDFQTLDLKEIGLKLIALAQDIRHCIDCDNYHCHVDNWDEVTRIVEDNLEQLCSNHQEKAYNMVFFTATLLAYILTVEYLTVDKLKTSK